MQGINSDMKAAPRDSRVELMERWVALNNSREQAQDDLKSTTARLDDIHNELRSLRAALLRVLDAEDEDVPMKSGEVYR